MSEPKNNTGASLCRDCLYHLLKAGTKRGYRCDEDTCTGERLGEWDTDRILEALAASEDTQIAEQERRRTMTYACIAIDPPWNERGGGKIKRGADRHYPLMKTPDIIRCVLTAPVWQPSESAHLWMWATDNHLPDALQVMSALGFRYIRTMAWVKQRNDKLQIGLGQYMRGSHELCLFGVRGKTMKPVKAPPSVVIAERTKHSSKPVEAFAAIEQVSPGPRLEMFARAARVGWDVWGNEVGCREQIAKGR